MAAYADGRVDLRELLRGLSAEHREAALICLDRASRRRGRPFARGFRVAWRVEITSSPGAFLMRARVWRELDEAEQDFILDIASQPLTEPTLEAVDAVIGAALDAKGFPGLEGRLWLGQEIPPLVMAVRGKWCWRLFDMSIEQAQGAPVEACA
jgi:hypothetical protein